MKALFSPPSMPALQPPPPPPTIDDTKQAEEDLARLRKRRGLMSTFLFGTGKPTNSSAMLLGPGASGAPSTGGSGSSTGGGSGGGGSASGMAR